MAVLDRSYRPWTGAPTPYWRRMLVIPRFALGDILSRKLFVTAYVAILLPPIGLLLAVYLSVNLPAIKQLVPLFGDMPLFEVGSGVYHVFWRLQVSFSTFFAIVVGPPLLSRDMANNALPLYFSKALRRSDYLAGKALVLVVLISFASWIPLGLIYCLHRAMADAGWAERNGAAGPALLLASLALIVTVTAIILAVSALVQRTRLAQVGLFAVLVLSSALAGALAGSTEQDEFLAVSPVLMIERVGEWAFRDETLSRKDERMRGAHVPVSRGLALFSLASWTGLAGLVLVRRIRPVEVVK